MNKHILTLLAFLLLSTAVQAQSTVNEKEAFALNMKKARKGDAEAQRLVAFAYERGTGVKASSKNAIDWFEKAAQGGDMLAQVRLGELLSAAGQKGSAVEWYRKAANQGSMDAQREMGRCYMKGWGVEKDTTEAFGWLLKAAEQGDLVSQKEVGIDYHEGTGTTQDYAESHKWLLKAAEQGDAPSQELVAENYADGKGVTKDMAEAVKWFRRSAEQGYTTAQFNLAVCYVGGEGVGKDVSEGVKWMEKAAAQDHKPAQRWLERYRRGERQKESVRACLEAVKNMTTQASVYDFNGEPRQGEAKTIKIWQKTANGYVYTGPKLYGFSRFRSEDEGYYDPYPSCLPGPYTKCTFTVSEATIKFTFEDAIQTTGKFKRVRHRGGFESDDYTTPDDFMKECLGCSGGTSSFTGCAYTAAGQLKLKITNTCTHKIYQTRRGPGADAYAPYRSVHHQTTTINLAESAKLNGLTKKELVQLLLMCEDWQLNKTEYPYTLNEQEEKVMFYFLWNTFGFSLD